MVTTSHIDFSHIQRVLMLAALITYLAPMLGSVEVSLRAFVYASVSSPENVTVAYEVMNSPAVVVDFN